jgi:hypothetical protein
MISASEQAEILRQLGVDVHPVTNNVRSRLSQPWSDPP